MEYKAKARTFAFLTSVAAVLMMCACAPSVDATGAAGGADAVIKSAQAAETARGARASEVAQAAEAAGRAQAAEIAQAAKASPQASPESHSIGTEDERKALAPEPNKDQVYSVRLEDLLSSRQDLDGQLVSFSGEAIGDLIKADSKHTWVMLEDQGYGLSVLMRNEDADKIEHLGKYGVRGSILQVVGVYHIADPDQAGELDVVARSVSLVESGYSYEEPVHWWKLILGLIFLGAALGLSLLYRYLRRRSL